MYRRARFRPDVTPRLLQPHSYLPGMTKEPPPSEGLGFLLWVPERVSPLDDALGDLPGRQVEDLAGSQVKV